MRDSDSIDSLPSLDPSPLEKAYMILSGQAQQLQPTRDHLEALDVMHRDRYARVIDELNLLEEQIRDIQDALHELAVELEAHRGETDV
ncbi:MAG: hypothetical protein KGI71_06390 [Patescibacteria group bacterium]|nr:hypothetical protein [Patescibacteria group bacterium]